MRRSVVVAVLVTTTAALVGCGSGGGAQTTASACQSAQRAFLATPSNAPTLIVRHRRAVSEACGTDSPQLRKDGAMLQREAVLDREYPTPMQMAERAVSRR